MVEFLVKHKLINTSQHGFLKARSCLTNLLCFLEEITKWVDDGSPVDVVYLDFQKAFDKVPYQRFLLKLKAHGIGFNVINWIEKWLTLRRQGVIVDGEISNWKSVLSGVPQGSVLGPMLFNIYIYINDLEDDISSKVLTFADDTKVSRKVTNVTDKQSLQNDLDKLVNIYNNIYIYIYINDLEDDISSKVLKFADDTKVLRKVTNDTDKQSLQDNLDTV